MQSSASSLLRWLCAHWLKRVDSVLSDVPLSVATLSMRAESWALIRVLRSARLRYVSLTWLLSPPLARATNDRPAAVMFQPSDSYARAQATRKFTARPRWAVMGPGWGRPRVPLALRVGYGYGIDQGNFILNNIEILIANYSAVTIDHVRTYIYMHKCGARSRSPNYLKTARSQ